MRMLLHDEWTCPCYNRSSKAVIRQKEGNAMLDFHHSWPYERVMNDIYFEECPFCHASPVLIPIKKKAVDEAFEGIKTHIVMPCCHEKIVVESMDSDYIWASAALR